MNRRELLDRASATAEERLLLGRVWDKYEQCRSRCVPTHTEFLSPQEQAAARRLLQAIGAEESEYAFFGGYEGAERRQLHFLPDWAFGPEEDEVAALSIESAPQIRVSYAIGDTVTIISGLFEGYTGTVQSISDDLKNVTVLVKRGHRDMPVELETGAVKLLESNS